MAAERNNWKSGKFFVTGGPVLVSCRTPLIWKAIVLLIFLKDEVRKAHSQLTICSDTPAQLQSDECVCVMFPPVRTKLLSKAYSRDLWHSWVFTQTGTKGSEAFNWNNIGLGSLWLVWFCRNAWFQPMISCRLIIYKHWCYQDMLAHNNPNPRMWKQILGNLFQWMLLWKPTMQAA